MKLELQANQEILTRIHENNVQTIETAQAAAGEDSESERESRPFIPGVQVRDTAWQALLDTGVSSYIDYELLLSLSETYSMQAIYKETGMHLVNASMTMAATATVHRAEIDNEVMQGHFMGYFTMLLTMEETLLNSYRESMKLL